MVITWPEGALRANQTPLMAALFDSLPPLVKTISSGERPSSLATWPRAPSTASRAGAPAQCALEGLPKESSRNGRIAAATSGATGVLALKSK